MQALVGVKPTLGPAWMWLGACYTMMSKHAEAIAALEKAREYRPHPLVEAWLASAYARAGRKKQATTVLAAELARLSAEKYISAFGIALRWVSASLTKPLQIVVCLLPCILVAAAW